MNILVTGGAGFIGSHIVDALVKKGHHVVVVDNLSTGKKENVNADAVLIELDINDPEILEIFKREKIDVVFHVAAQIDVRKSVANPVDDARQNILGSINVLEACKTYGVKKIIFSSTGGAIYGDTDIIPTPETHIEQPISPYGIAKLAVEKYLHYYHVVHGLNYTILRYANVYGPRQNSKGEAGVVSIFCDQLVAGASPVINGDGTQTRDYVYVGDVVNANLVAFDANKIGKFNIGTGVETDINKLSALLIDALGALITFSHGPGKPGEQRRSLLDCSSAKKELGWQPIIELKEGLAKTLEYFKESKK